MAELVRRNFLWDSTGRNLASAVGMGVLNALICAQIIIIPRRHVNEISSWPVITSRVDRAIVSGVLVPLHHSEKLYDDPSRIAREHARYKIGRNKRARMELISDGVHWAVKSKLRLPCDRNANFGSFIGIARTDTLSPAHRKIHPTSRV